jgi:hypothetical protein
MPGRHKKTELVWAAGVLDSDGHIGVHWQKPNPKRREINGRWRLVVQVTGCIEAIPLKKMQELFGGSIHWRFTPNGKRTGYWTVSQRKAGSVLIVVAPYLVGKADYVNDILNDRGLTQKAA